MADLHINSNKGWKYKWTEYEDEIIRKYYNSGGYERVKKYIPHRTDSSIQARASKLGVRYLTYNKEYFNIIDSPTKAYWLGFLYADGYVTSDDRWGLELQLSDMSHMKNLLDELSYSGNIKTRDRKGIESCSFLIKNKDMTNSLKDKGVIPNKTCCLEFPSVDVLENKYYSHFIRGFFDGDGCVSYGYITKPRKDRNNKIYTRLHKEINIVCKADNFVKELLKIMLNNDITLHHNINRQHNNLNVIKTSSISDIINFYKYIYSDSNPTNRLNRKFNKFNDLFIATNNSDVIKKIS